MDERGYSDHWLHKQTNKKRKYATNVSKYFQKLYREFCCYYVPYMVLYANPIPIQ